MAVDDAPVPGSMSGSNVFSLDDLDKIIESEDPNFKNEMAQINAAVTEIKADIDSLDIDEPGDIGAETENVELSSKEKIVAFIFKPWRKLKEIYKLKKLVFKNKMRMFLEQTKSYIRNELPERLKYYKSRARSQAQWLSGYLSGEWGRFKKLNLLQKTALIFVVSTSVIAVFIFSRIYVGSVLPQFEDPLVHSLADEAKLVSSYKDKNELQDLFEAFPQVEFNVLLARVIVNLRPDAQSGRNPMGAYELYIGLDSQDTAIEVKDREKEILDIVQRVFEKFSYSEVVTQVGKVRMKSVVRDRINEILNQGKVTHVYFNTFVTTP